MAEENIDVHLRLKNQRAFVKGTQQAEKGVKGVGKATDDVAKKAKRAERSTGKLRGSFNLLGGGTRLAVGTVGGTIGLYGVSSALKLMYDEANEARKATAATQQALKTTGASAWTSSKQIAALAESISNKTGIDDETIQSTENLLLTFTKIRNEAGKGNDAFNQATQAIVDMSAVQGSLEGNTKAVGKALQDPVKGITALARVGVTFDKATKDRIESLVENNDVLSAQRIILSELKREFGGQAAAQATPLEKLRTTFNNLAETAGTALLPYVDKAANALSKFIREAQKGTGTGGKFVQTVKDLWQSVKPTVVFLGKLAYNTAKFAAEHPRITKAAVALTAVGVAVNTIRTSKAIAGLRSLTGLLKRGGCTAGTAGAKSTASCFESGFGPALNSKKGRMSKTMRVFGGALGVAGGVALVASFHEELEDLGGGLAKALGLEGSLSREADNPAAKVWNWARGKPKQGSFTPVDTGFDPNAPRNPIGGSKPKRPAGRKPRVQKPKAATINPKALAPLVAAGGGGGLPAFDLFIDGEQVHAAVARRGRAHRSRK